MVSAHGYQQQFLLGVNHLTRLHQQLIILSLLVAVAVVTDIKPYHQMMDMVAVVVQVVSRQPLILQ
jgi:accessory gene regulator protein AgrB